MNPSVRHILTQESRHFVHESGFFRIGDKPLDPEVVRNSSSHVRQLFQSRAGDRRDRAEMVLSSTSGKLLFTRGVGHRLAFDYFGSVILHERSIELESALRDYLNRCVIRDDVRLVPWGRNKNIPSVLRRVAQELARAHQRPDPEDLVDIAFASTSSVDAAAEILLRLVLATVGSTGAALEWMLIDISREASFADEPPNKRASLNFARESLRLSSPACRLARTVDDEFAALGFDFVPGAEIVLNTRAANRDSLVWHDGASFTPARWDESDAARLDVTFGKGSRSCPAQHPSVEFLAAVHFEISRRYKVTFHRFPFSREIVGTLAIPPRGAFTLRQVPDLRPELSGRKDAEI